ncbi:MAG TPA: hypothetical protein VGF82_14640 [Terracidiphilus sp.]
MKTDRLFFLGLGVVLIAGCGGSSGGGSTGGGDAATVSISFSTATPTVVAAKIGAGSFSPQSLNGEKLSLSIPAGTTDFAVAYLCTAPSFPAFERIFEATTADGSSFTLPCPANASPDSTGTLTGSVDAGAIPDANLLAIAGSNGSQSAVAAVTADTNFSVTVPAGTDRVEVLAYNSTSQGPLATSTLVAARSFDNQLVPGPLDGGSQVVLGAADRIMPEPITYSNLSAGYTPSAFVELVMAGGAGAFLVSQSTTQYPALPAGAIKSDDRYVFIANAINSAKPTEMMFTAESATSAGPISFSFPAPWSYTGPTPAALPSFNFAYTGFPQNSAVNQTALISWGSSLTTQISMIATAAYQNGSTSLAIPDLSALPGFVPAPPSGTLVLWIALIEQNNGGAQQPMSTNSLIASVENSGTFRVP